MSERAIYPCEIRYDTPYVCVPLGCHCNSGVHCTAGIEGVLQGNARSLAVDHAQAQQASVVSEQEQALRDA